MQQIQNDNCSEAADEKNGIEPPMVEVKVKSTQHFGDYDPIFCRHIHAHQQHGRAKVHAHYLRHDQHNYVRGLARADFVEELGEGEQKATYWGDYDNADEEEAHVLAPEGDVHVEATPVHGDFDATRYGILFADAIENYVDCRLERENWRFFKIR